MLRSLDLRKQILRQKIVRLFQRAPKTNPETLYIYAYQKNSSQRAGRNLSNSDISPGTVENSVDLPGSHSKTSRGFALITTLFLMPALMMIFFLVSLQIFWLRALNHHQHLCRQSALNVEQVWSEKYTQLFLLNSPIKLNRQKLQTLQLEQKIALASGQKGLALAMQIEINRTRAELELLRQTQNLRLLSLNEWKFQSILQLQKSFAPITKSYPWATFSSQISHGPLLSLPLKTDQPREGPPIYKPEDNFEEKQLVEVKWNLFLKTNFQNFKNFDLHKKSICSATIQLQRHHDGEYELIPVLSRDQFLLSS